MIFEKPLLFFKILVPKGNHHSTLLLTWYAYIHKLVFFYILCDRYSLFLSMASEVKFLSLLTLVKKIGLTILILILIYYSSQK